MRRDEGVQDFKDSRALKSAVITSQYKQQLVSLACNATSNKKALSGNVVFVKSN